MSEPSLLFSRRRFTSVKSTGQKSAGDNTAVGPLADAADALADATTANDKAVEALPSTTKLLPTRKIRRGATAELEAVDAQQASKAAGGKAVAGLGRMQERR
jgi:hypothetical protein